LEALFEFAKSLKLKDSETQLEKTLIPSLLLRRDNQGRLERKNKHE